MKFVKNSTFLKITKQFVDIASSLVHCSTHHGPATPRYDIDLRQLWFRWWLVVWRHQVITRTNVDLSLKVFCGILEEVLIFKAMMLCQQKRYHFRTSVAREKLFVQENSNENIKAKYHCHLDRETTGDTHTEPVIQEAFLSWRAYGVFNTLRPRQNGRHFADDIFKCIFLNENVWIPTKISLKFFPKGPINNIPALVSIMAWRRPGDKPLSEPMMVSLATHICVTRPQWVKAVNQV